MRTLREALEHTPTALLRQMACFWEIAGAEEAGRPGLVAGLLARMGRAEVVQQALRRLDRQERQALRTVLAAGGRVQAPLMARAYGPLRSQQLAQAEEGALNPTERLHRHGFLFRAYASWEDWRGAILYIPTELWPFLPRVPRAAAQEALQPLDPQGIHPAPADLALHRDLACLLALLQREIHPLPEGEPGPGERDRAAGLRHALEALLSPAHPAYAAFLLQTSRRAGLFAPDVEGVLRPTAEGRQWLRATPWLRLQVLFPAWRDHPTWDDLAAVPELLVERPWPADLSLPRRRVLQHLASLSLGSWFPLAGWVRTMEAQDPEFLRPGGAAGRPRIRLREGGAAPDSTASWSEVEGRYLRFLVEGPLHWLGLADLGQAKGKATAFRLTPAGYALLHPEAALPEGTDEPAIVEGTFEVWAPLEASPYLVFLLEGWAERVRRDRISQYRLTRERVHRALQRGERVERLLEALAQHGRGEVPQNVAFTLHEWAATYGRLRLRRPILLQAQEVLLLEEVLADPQVQAASAAHLSPTAVEVGVEQAATMVARLLQLGHLPQVEEGILPAQDRFSLDLTPGQGVLLLALLEAWGEAFGKGEQAQALAELAGALARALPVAGRNRARRQKERWLRAWRSGE